MHIVWKEGCSLGRTLFMVLSADEPDVMARVSCCLNAQRVVINMLLSEVTRRISSSTGAASGQPQWTRIRETNAECRRWLAFFHPGGCSRTRRASGRVTSRLLVALLLRDLKLEVIDSRWLVAEYDTGELVVFSEHQNDSVPTQSVRCANGDVHAIGQRAVRGILRLRNSALPRHFSRDCNRMLAGRCGEFSVASFGDEVLLPVQEACRQFPGRLYRLCRFVACAW